VHKPRELFGFVFDIFEAKTIAMALRLSCASRSALVTIFWTAIEVMEVA